jgi:hypothetical protein
VCCGGNCCVQQWDLLCWVMKLSVVCDKGEGSRYWTVLTVITHKLLLHVQLNISTAHLLYKYCTNCTVCNWTVLTAITQKLLLHVQLQDTAKVRWCLLKWSAASCLELYEYVDSHMKRLDTSNSCHWLQAQCCNFHSDKEQADVTKITDWQTVQTEGQLMYCQCQVPICVNIYWMTNKFTVTNWQQR